MRVWSAIAGVFVAMGIQLTCSLPCLAAVLCPENPADRVRLDCRTVIVQPAADDGRVRVDAFFGFRTLSTKPCRLLLILPVAGPVESAKAQAMTLTAFDAAYTHGENLESAFYRATQSRAKGKLCTFTGIGAGSGLPGWILLALRWNTHGPAMTAVVPPPRLHSDALPEVMSVEVIRGAALLRRLPNTLAPSVRSTLQKYRRGFFVVASVVAPGTPDAEQGRFADSGVRVSFKAAGSQMEDEWVYRFPLATDPATEAPALSRFYVVSPWNRRAALHLPYEPGRPGSPQRVVNNVLALFDRPERIRADRADEAPCVKVTSIGTPSGGQTIRAVATFQRSDEDMVATFKRYPAGAMRVTLMAVGTVLDGLLWPLVGAIILASVWYAMRTYFWATQLPTPKSPWRSYALIVALGPLLTPWFMLRYLAPGGKLPEDPDTSGALGVLPMRTYECLVRLLLWALIVCVNWALIGGLADLAYCLRFG